MEEALKYTNNSLEIIELKDINCLLGMSISISNYFENKKNKETMYFINR